MIPHCSRRMVFSSTPPRLRLLFLAPTVQYQQYADDLQLYLSFSPNSSELALIENCTSDVSRLFLENAVLLSPTKTEAIVFSTRQRLCRIDHSTAIDVAGSKVALSDSIKLLGLTLDSTLSFDRYVPDIVRSCYFHIRT